MIFLQSLAGCHDDEAGEKGREAMVGNREGPKQPGVLRARAGISFSMLGLGRRASSKTRAKSRTEGGRVSSA